MIINPIAGHRRADRYHHQLVEYFSERGMQVTELLTQKRGDAESAAFNMASDFDLVVCVGGDGTLNEVISGLMRLETRPRIGYIPTGTTNDFASTLNLPRNVMKAAEKIIDGQTIQLDIGFFGEKAFAYVASFGTLCSVAYATPQKWKNRFGWLAYFTQGVKLLFKAKPRHVRIQAGATAIEDDFLFGAVSNSTSIAGFIKLSKNSISLDDGAFEVTLIKNPKDLLSFLHVVNCVLLQKIDETYVMRFQAREVDITCDQGLEWCLDGEDGGVHKRVTIRNCKRSLALIT